MHESMTSQKIKKLGAGGGGKTFGGGHGPPPPPPAGYGPGCVCEIEKNGKRVFLEPVNGKELTKLGDGLYLKKNIIKCTMEKDCCQDQTVI